MIRPSVSSLVPAAGVPHSLTLMVVSTYRQTRHLLDTTHGQWAQQCAQYKTKTTALQLPGKEYALFATELSEPLKDHG